MLLYASGSNRLRASESRPLIHVITFPISNLVVSQQQGLFINLLQNAAENIGYELKIEVFPPKRARILFCKGMGDILFPYVNEVRIPDCKLESTSTFFRKQDYLFSPQGSYKKIADLEGKSLGLVQGFTYPLQMPPNLRIVKVADDQTLAKMIELKRIDAFLSQIVVMLPILCSGNEASQIQPAPEAVASLDVRIATRKSEEKDKKKLAEKIAQAARQQMKAVGGDPFALYRSLNNSVEFKKCLNY